MQNRIFVIRRHSILLDGLEIGNTRKKGKMFSSLFPLAQVTVLANSEHEYRCQFLRLTCSFRLAYSEMRLIIARILWNFEMSMCNKREVWTDQKVYWSWERPPLMMELKERHKWSDIDGNPQELSEPRSHRASLNR